MARGKRSTQFETFLRRVHHRQVLLKIFERSGLGVLGGCAAALPLILILLWRGQSAGEVAVGGLILGAIAGLIWGFITRPSLMQAAIEADRQLKWEDLLSSAWAIRSRQQEDPWAGMLLATAETKCTHTSPSAVVLNRLGARAWGGIGLAAALVGVLGLLPAVATLPTEANAISDPIFSSDETQPASSPVTSVRRTSDRHAAIQADPDEPTASHIDGMQSDSSHAPAPETRVDDAGANRKAGEASSAGRGIGASRSPDSQGPQLARPQEGTRGENRAGPGKSAAGVGAPSGEAGGDASPSGQMAGPAAGQRPDAPAWQSSNWAQDADRANQAVETGRVPDAYRDVIRAYFDRQ